MAFIILSILGNRPSPSCKLANLPVSGSITNRPRSRNFSTASIVAGFCHIRKFMAGTNNAGCSHTDKLVEMISSATPLAALHSIFAVAGTTTIASKFMAISICSSPAFGVFGKTSVITSLFVRAEKEAFPTNF